ncbi:unnamed protein product [Pleuronectes platessa]|uniref:Uncharacterized protein n=1 Tax=Pleuronectes platessa TaxID=8262 RepID=A0A9N7UTT5_PLEPL|nr:unnamed protein product [Pleuronectes platessa]
MPQVSIVLEKARAQGTQSPGFLNFTQRCEKLPIGHSGQGPVLPAFSPASPEGEPGYSSSHLLFPSNERSAKVQLPAHLTEETSSYFKLYPTPSCDSMSCRKNSKRHLRCTAQQNR